LELLQQKQQQRKDPLKLLDTNNQIFMKNIYIAVLLLIPVFTIGQTQKISLEDAVEMAQTKSPDYQLNLFRNEGSYWRNKNYLANMLPQFGLSATLPSFSNRIISVTNENGDDNFVQQNQTSLETSLYVSQNVAFTGGRLQMRSNLERITKLGDTNTEQFNFIPFSINYFQNSIFYNPFKWDKKIEPLLFEESKREFIESMERISSRTSRFYFNLLKAQIQLKIAENNLSNQDTLFQIAKGRFRMGKIAENDLLQMELSYINSQTNLTSRQITLKSSSQDLVRYLDLDSEDIELEIPENLAPFDVSTEKALQEAEVNRKFIIQYRRERLVAEKELARAKGDNGLTLGITANFGMSQHGPEFNELFEEFDQQQSVRVTLGIPIFDWGVSKSEKRMAQARLDLVNVNLKQDKQEFEQEIYLHTLNWANQRNFLASTEKAQEIALKRYDITKKRYVLGKLTITDLNLAQESKDKSVLNYLNSLEKFWLDYYTLRQLTLYDFLNDKKIEVEDILYE
jgi:outer membrane protein TolC